MRKIATIVILAVLTFGGTAQADNVKKKLKIVIPKIRMENATIEETIAELRRLSKLMDPDGEGINIIYVKSKEAKKEPPKKIEKK